MTLKKLSGFKNSKSLKQADNESGKSLQKLGTREQARQMPVRDAKGISVSAWGWRVGTDDLQRTFLTRGIESW